MFLFLNPDEQPISFLPSLFPSGNNRPSGLCSRPQSSLHPGGPSGFHRPPGPQGSVACMPFSARRPTPVEKHQQTQGGASISHFPASCLWMLFGTGTPSCESKEQVPTWAPLKPMERTKHPGCFRILSQSWRPKGPVNITVQESGVCLPDPAPFSRSLGSPLFAFTSFWRLLSFLAPVPPAHEPSFPCSMVTSALFLLLSSLPLTPSLS